MFDIGNREGIFAVTDSVYLSALSFAATGDAVYATHVNEAINTFFVNQSTRMNPNLNYAQVIRGPGDQSGDKTGVLDMERMSKLVSGVEVIRQLMPIEWDPATEQGLMDWAKEMVAWLTTDEMALEEKASNG